jgi:acyl-CoA dehydrogenase
MDFTLPESIGPLRATVRRFVEAELRPHESELPPAEGSLAPAVRRVIEARRRADGLWGLTAPPAQGGRGLSWLEQAIVQEEAHRSLLGMWPHGLFAAGEAPAPLYAAPRFLQPCLEGSRRAHQVLAADGLRVRTHGGGAVVDGTLRAVPAFAAGDLLVVVAGDVGLVCEPGLGGYRVERRRPGMGTVELVDLVWEGSALEPGRVLWGAGRAGRLWQAQVRATVLAAGAVGAAERCLEQALRHVQARQTFGKPLAERQAIQWMVADSARELHAARLLVYRAAAAADGGADPARAAARAKAYATEAACRVVDRVIQMHGGYGYTRDLPFERYWRDLRYYRLAAGVNAALLAADAAAAVADLDR